ncbi:hypothetical protein NSI01_31310 [Pimelobacter simplex]|nr:hypothetical protein NSI01_31310 [Pimelobacter simplex]
MRAGRGPGHSGGKTASKRAKNASRQAERAGTRTRLGLMSIESCLLIAGVIAVAIYLLVALVLPERF